MAVHYAHGKSTTAASLKVFLAAFIGVMVALAASRWLGWRLYVLLGWDAAAVMYTLWIWSSVWRLSGVHAAAHAVREDPSRGLADAMVLFASVASLAAVGLVLFQASNAAGLTRLLLVLLGVLSVVVAWVVVHTLFALRYAELYYSAKPTPGGVEFDGVTQPSYQDFAYLAFTMGMTFQVSDTGFRSTAFRRMALKHALISYLFGTVIVATTINLIAGLTK